MTTTLIRQIIARSGLDAYNEEISAACDAIDAQLSALEQQGERRRVELAHAWNTKDRLIQILVGIHSLLYPSPVNTPDGRTFVFRPSDPNPHEILQALSERIRAIPDEIDNFQHPAADLTDEQIRAIGKKFFPKTILSAAWFGFARAIIAALRAKEPAHEA